MNLDQKSDSIINRLPYDVLYRILDDPELSWDGSYPSVSASKECPWSNYLKTRKNIVKVCRAWRIAGASFLYSTIYLHRIGHLTAFVDLLKNNQRDQLCLGDGIAATSVTYGDCVRHIHANFYVPLIWYDVYKQEMIEALHLCPKLQTLDIRPLWDGGFTSVPETSLLWTIHNRAADLPVYCFDSQIGTTSIFSNLTKLRLNIDLDSETCTSLTQGVAFENLECLACDVLSSDAYPGLAQISTWVIPKLRSLSLTLSWFPRQTSRVNLTPVDLICDKFGSRLRSFLIDNRMCKNAIDGTLSHVLVRCPHLETLVYCQEAVHAVSPNEASQLKVHTSLRRVEYLWSYSCRLGAAGIFMNRSIFPNLRTFLARDPIFDELPVRSIYGLKGSRIDPESDEIKMMKDKGYQFLNRFGEPIVYDIDPDMLRSQSDPSEGDWSDDESTSSLEEGKEWGDRAYKLPMEDSSSAMSESCSSDSEPLSDHCDEDDADSLIDEIVNRAPRTLPPQITQEEALVIVASMPPVAFLEDFAVRNLNFLCLLLTEIENFSLRAMIRRMQWMYHERYSYRNNTIAVGGRHALFFYGIFISKSILVKA